MDRLRDRIFEPLPMFALGCALLVTGYALVQSVPEDLLVPSAPDEGLENAIPKITFIIGRLGQVVGGALIGFSVARTVIKE